MSAADHDHQRCIDRVMREVDARLRSREINLTPVRRRVLDMLLESHKAVGAYDLLHRLKNEGMAAQPPVAYRALDFLMNHGLVHKIERLNAYIACTHPHENHDPAFMICRVCRSVAEARSTPARGALGRTAKDIGFRIERTMVEAIGVCPICQAHEEAGA